jgi:hypothetical protein
MMRKIDFAPPATLNQADQAWWQTWTESARNATTRLIAAWERWAAAAEPRGAAPRPNEAIWTEFKNRLLGSVFQNKCAYCECGKPARWPVQVEHFRPKGAVTYRLDTQGPLQTARTIDAAGNQIDHPGYFWLAYDWRNLLPCCARCNSAKGKNTQFPLAGAYVFLMKLTPADGAAYARATESKAHPGMYYPAPEDLDRLEQPSLVNPCIDSPSEHIGFGIRGLGSGHSTKGTCTMAVFDLHDEDLRQARQTAQERGAMTYAQIMLGHLAAGMPWDQARDLAQGALEGLRPQMEYSAAVFDGLPRLWDDARPV